MSKKPVVTTTNGLSLVLAVNMQNQQNSRFYVLSHCPVVVLRLNNYFQLRHFIFYVTKIVALSFIFVTRRSKFQFLLKAVFSLLNYDS